MMSEFSSLFFCNCKVGNLSWRDDSNDCNEIIICHNYSPPLNVSVQFIDFPSRQLAKYTSPPVWPAAVVEIFFCDHGVSTGLDMVTMEIWHWWWVDNCTDFSWYSIMMGSRWWWRVGDRKTKRFEKIKFSNSISLMMERHYSIPGYGKGA